MNSRRPCLLLLDLDNTLWDFDANAEEALSVLFHRHDLHLRSGFKVHEFVALYQVVNKSFWKMYEKGEIQKDFLRTARFTETFRQMGIPDHQHPESVWEEYLEICPVMTRMIPGAIPFLQEMKEICPIGLVTNGFEKTQNLKIKHTGINQYIDFMVTSESAGIAKPNPGIFSKALALGETKPTDVIYMGDNWETDVEGGIKSGLRTIWFNRNSENLPENSFSKHRLFIGEVAGLMEAASFIGELANK